MIRTFNITKPDDRLRAAIQEKTDNLNKPKGALGRLETLAMQVCLIQQTLTPRLDHPCHLLLGGDHGIAFEGVSLSPREVTWQQMINFTRGGGGVNMFCRQHGFDLKIVDMGVDHDLTPYPTIMNHKIGPGTRDFLYEPAMTYIQYLKAINTGCQLTDLCHGEGCNVLCIGEMGIGNTSPSSIWLHLFTGTPLKECIGAGSGLDSQGIAHKYDILRQALDRFHRLCPSHNVEQVLSYFGGFEMVAAIGAMLRAAELHLIILVDGFIMTACAMAACMLYPDAQAYMVFTHCGDEAAHDLMLRALNTEPLLRLGLRLGEGTGALCAYPLVDSAVRMMNEMNNFENANITKYF